MINFPRYLILFLFLFSLTSCFTGSAPTIDSEIVELENTSWELIRPKELTGTISFNEDLTKVSGSSGCNRYTADLTKKNYQIEFGTFITTERYCESEDGKERAFMVLLSKTKDYTLSGNRLTFLGYEGQLLTFKASDE